MMRMMTRAFSHQTATCVPTTDAFATPRVLRKSQLDVVLHDIILAACAYTVIGVMPAGCDCGCQVESYVTGSLNPLDLSTVRVS